MEWESRIPVKPCAHKNFFTRASIGRITESAPEGVSVEDLDPHSFVAELSIECTECAQKFGFKGVESGYNFDSPTQALDGVTIHLPLRTPAEMTMAGPAAALSIEGRRMARGMRIEVLAAEEGMESALMDAVRQRTSGWLASYREGLASGLDDVEAQRMADARMEEEFGGKS